RRGLAAAAAGDTAVSPLTAALVAAELLPKLVEARSPTPASWPSQTDELEYVGRHEQLLKYLQTCYETALRAAPASWKGGPNEAVLKDLIQDLDKSCQKGIQIWREVTGNTCDKFKTVPKYYFSELRGRRKCALPQPPVNLTEEATLSFLCVEVVAGLRRAERFELFARKADTVVPAERWEKNAKVAKARASDIMAAAVRIFGERRVETELMTCIKEENEVSREMLDGSSGRVRFGARPGEDPAAEDDADDDEGDACDISAALRPVFIVSDCTGESAQHTVDSALGQFSHCFDRSTSVNMTVYRFCSEAEIEGIVALAKEKGAFIVHTLVDPRVNAALVEQCDSAGVDHHDLWGRLLEKLEGYFDVTRSAIPGQRQVVDEKYFQMIECIEYTRTLDDGVLPHRWAEADIIILGPSRTGKTPLSFFMSQRGYKVANYPIVPGEDLPKELWDFDQDRVFALTIDPQKLSSIRSNRMQTLKMGSGTAYAKASKVQEEIAWCRALYKKNPRWTVLDTTYAGIEESSASIMKVRKAALHSVNVVCLCPSCSEILRGHTDFIFERIKEDSKQKPELIREVDLGPFKHKVDDGLPLRKFAYTVSASLLQAYTEQVASPSLIDLVLQ
ncbi:unnamed protein product, partial [Prorocentrum cordatum]